MNSLPPSLRRFMFFGLVILFAVVLPMNASAAKRDGNTATADLVVSKSGDETAPLGGLITYTIGAYNAGPDDAVNVVVIDVVPAHTSFVSADVSVGSVNFDGTIVTASFGTLPFDSFATLTLVLRVDEDAPRGTVISNTANGASSSLDNDDTNNAATTLTAVSGPFAGDFLISEFRLSGPGGATDEFIELYNNTDAPISVKTTDDSSGWALAASDGIIRFTIPNGTVIPARGHFLGVNVASSSALRSASVSNAGLNIAAPIGDATYISGVPNDTGIAVFRTSNTQNFSLATRLDAVGSTAESNTLYKEGAGYPAIGLSSIDYAFVRDHCGKGGAINVFGPCPSNGLPKDTDNNAVDFYFVDTQGTNAGAGQRLGAPGPETLADPVTANDALTFSSLDRTVANSAAPNRVRDLTSDPANNSTFGTLDIRRRVSNNSGFPVSRLRFRIVDISTLPAPAGIADLRARTSGNVLVAGINDNLTCPGGSTPCSVTVTGTTLEQPPSQPLGGGFNSSLSSDTITLATPLAVGDSFNVHFLLGVQQTGSFKFFVNVELLTDQSEPSVEAGAVKASRKSLRGQQRAAGVGQPTSTPQTVVPNVPTRTSAVELPTPSGLRIIPILNLNDQRDDATTRKGKKKKRGKKSPTAVTVN